MLKKDKKFIIQMDEMPAKSPKSQPPTYVINIPDIVVSPKPPKPKFVAPNLVIVLNFPKMEKIVYDITIQHPVRKPDVSEKTVFILEEPQPHPKSCHMPQKTNFEIADLYDWARFLKDRGKRK